MKWEHPEDSRADPPAMGQDISEPEPAGNSLSLARAMLAASSIWLAVGIARIFGAGFKRMHALGGDLRAGLCAALCTGIVHAAYTAKAVPASRQFSLNATIA